MRSDKLAASATEAVSGVTDGATIMIGGFGGPGGMPSNLILALRDLGPRNLTIISNTAGLPGFGAKAGEEGLNMSVLFENGQVSKVVATFPVPRSASIDTPFQQRIRAGEVELEVVPQGTFVERIRAGGAGIPAFYTPTGAGTLLAEGKEEREFGGRRCVLEHALRADFALIRAFCADPWGNLTYRGTSRSFNPAMATAADVTIAEVDEIVELGALDPESIVTQGVYVDRVARRGDA